jgi:hypothetical protein
MELNESQARRVFIGTRVKILTNADVYEVDWLSF